MSTGSLGMFSPSRIATARPSPTAAAAASRSSPAPSTSVMPALRRADSAFSTTMSATAATVMPGVLAIWAIRPEPI